MWNTAKRIAIVEQIKQQDGDLKLRTIARQVAGNPESIDEVLDDLERAIKESGELKLMQKYNVGWQWKGLEINGDLAFKN